MLLLHRGRNRTRVCHRSSPPPPPRYRCTLQVCHHWTSNRLDIPGRYWQGKDTNTRQAGSIIATHRPTPARRQAALLALNSTFTLRTSRVKKPRRDLAPTRTRVVHFLKEPCPLTEQQERRKFLPVQSEILYGRENHFYLCSTYCNSHQASQALKALMDPAVVKGKSSSLGICRAPLHLHNDMNEHGLSEKQTSQETLQTLHLLDSKHSIWYHNLQNISFQIPPPLKEGWRFNLDNPCLSSSKHHNSFFLLQHYIKVRGNMQALTLKSISGTTEGTGSSSSGFPELLSVHAKILRAFEMLINSR